MDNNHRYENITIFDAIKYADEYRKEVSDSTNNRYDIILILYWKLDNNFGCVPYDYDPNYFRYWMPDCDIFDYDNPFGASVTIKVDTEYDDCLEFILKDKNNKYRYNTIYKDQLTRLSSIAHWIEYYQSIGCKDDNIPTYILPDVLLDYVDNNIVIHTHISQNMVQYIPHRRLYNMEFRKLIRRVCIFQARIRYKEKEYKEDHPIKAFIKEKYDAIEYLYTGLLIYTNIYLVLYLLKIIPR